MMEPTSDALIHSPTAGRGWAVSGLILMGMSAAGIYWVVRGVAGMLAGIGNEEAHNIAKMTAYYRKVGVHLAGWTTPGLIGLALISVALLSKGNREKWFLIWGLIMALVWLLVFFPFGLYLTVIFLMRWKRFLPPASWSAGS